MINKSYDGVFIRKHRDDPETLELYTMRNNGSTVVWGVVHIDMLSEIAGMITGEDLDNHEYELSAHYPVIINK